MGVPVSPVESCRCELLTARETGKFIVAMYKSTAAGVRATQRGESHICRFELISLDVDEKESRCMSPFHPFSLLRLVIGRCDFMPVVAHLSLWRWIYAAMREKKRRAPRLKRHPAPLGGYIFIKTFSDLPQTSSFDSIF